MYFERLHAHPNGYAGGGKYKPHQQHRVPTPGFVAHNQSDQEQNRPKDAEDEKNGLQVHKDSLEKPQANTNKRVTAFDPKESRRVCQDFLDPC